MNDIRPPSKPDNSPRVPTTSSREEAKDNANIRRMTFDTERLLPFLTEDSNIIHNESDHESTYNTDLNYTRHQDRGGSLAFNEYHDKHAAEFFSDSEKVSLRGKYLETFEDPRFTGIRVYSVTVAGSELSFFAENKPGVELRDEVEVNFGLNAFATGINKAEQSETGYGIIKLNDDSGCTVNQNEYHVNGKVLKKVGSPYYNNCYFSKYLVEVNHRGQLIELPVLVSTSVQGDLPEFEAGERVSLNVNFHGEFS